MATKRWLGDAIAIKQVNTITIANAWTAGDTVTVTCNSKDLILTAGSTVTTDSIAAQLSAAINAGSATDGVVDTETRNLGGQEIPELTEVVATVASSVVTVTGVQAGVPFTITVTESTASTGTATGAVATAATGPNHLSNQDNWSGSWPVVDGDTLRWDQGNVDCLYDLDYFRTNTIEFYFERTTDYTGAIGLPEFNESGGYHEYRTRYLQGYEAATITSYTVKFYTGIFDGEGGTTRLDLDGLTVADLDIQHANRAGGQDVVEISGGTIDTANVGKGYVIFEPITGPASTKMTLNSSLHIGGDGLTDADTRFILGSDFDDSAGPYDIKIRGGNSIFVGDTTNTDGGIDIKGGTLELRETSVHPYLIVKGGTVYPITTGALTTVVVWSGGTVDWGRMPDIVAGPATLLSAHGGATLKFAGQNITAPTLVGCFFHEVNITY